MKAHLTVFALTAILVVSIGMAPAFGQSSISVTTDKSSYSEGEVITVTGQVANMYSGTPVSVIVMTPDGLNRVGLAQETVGADKMFSTTFTAGGPLWSQEGAYTITVQYGTVNRSATTTFEFEGSTETQTTEVSPNVTDTTVSVQGSSDLIGYEITGGKLVDISPDVESNSLIISIDATSDGSLTLTIPRSVLDAKMDNGEDIDFFILMDGEEVDFEETTSSTDRTLTIAFQAGAEEIEIIGTFVIPEFGTIAAMILAVAIISIIAISAKSKLSIIPRY